MSLTRRNFLKTSLLASAAITFIGKASAGTPVAESDAQAKSWG